MPVAHPLHPNRLSRACLSPAQRKMCARSRTDNDYLALPGVDGRSHWGRRRREIITKLIAAVEKLHPIGERDHILISAATALALRAEQLQVRITQGDDVDDEQLMRLTNSLARLLAKLGLDPRYQEKEDETLPHYQSYKRGR